MSTNFHEIRFPLEISLESRGGPERLTDIIKTKSGHEKRNARWEFSIRKYDAGYGIKTFNDLSRIVDFFEERRGRLYGFRWRDRLDFKSCTFEKNPHFLDQHLGIGDGKNFVFQMIKRYGEFFDPYERVINKLVEGSVLIAVNGKLKESQTEYSVDYKTGKIFFNSFSVPKKDDVVTGGFLFDVPVRFDVDFLDIDLRYFFAGTIPKIPLVEIIM